MDLVVRMRIRSILTEKIKGTCARPALARRGFENRRLHVRQHADRYKAIGRPKSKSSTRTVPLPPDVINALREWKAACPPGEEGLVCTYHADGGAGHGDEKAAHVVDGDGQPKYAPHAFRHFFASWCINPKDRGGRELPPKQVQHLLGHSSIVMTLDTYGHLFREGGDRTERAEATRLLLA